MKKILLTHLKTLGIIVGGIISIILALGGFGIMFESQPSKFTLACFFIDLAIMLACIYVGIYKWVKQNKS